VQEKTFLKKILIFIFSKISQSKCPSTILYVTYSSRYPSICSHFQLLSIPEPFFCLATTFIQWQDCSLHNTDDIKICFTTKKTPVLKFPVKFLLFKHRRNFPRNWRFFSKTNHATTHCKQVVRYIVTSRHPAKIY
jgi:hypothetical protein